MNLSGARKPSAFDLYHPAVPALFFLAAIVFSMAAFHPVYLIISLVAAFSYSVFLRGWRAVLQTVAWQLPLVLIIAVLNPLFSMMGSTELFRIGARAVYLESFLYGLLMGVMLVSMLMWFSNASNVLSSDKVMSLTGGIAPIIGLMITMVMRLVPQFVSRGSEIMAAQRACTAACMQPASAEGKAAKRHMLSQRLRQVSVLMGWSMEDSLETSDAMRARGWGAAPKRTTYARHRLRSRDMAALVVLVLLIAINAVLAVVACGQFQFYPRMSDLVLWWGYVPYAVLVAIPLVMEWWGRVKR